MKMDPSKVDPVLEVNETVKVMVTMVSDKMVNNKMVLLSRKRANLAGF